MRTLQTLNNCILSAHSDAFKAFEAIITSFISTLSELLQKTYKFPMKSFLSNLIRIEMKCIMYFSHVMAAY